MVKKKIISKNWKKTLIRENKKIKDAIKVLGFSEFQVLLVVDANKKFLGTLTDGDIRRGLIKGLSLNAKISEIMNSQAILVPPGTDRETAKQLMLTNSILQLPVVKKNKNIVGLYYLKDFLKIKKKNNPFVIMAGGKGLRLRPITNSIPKPMIKINGKPIIETIIENAKKQGFYNFIIITNYLSKVIEDHFRNNSKFDVKISILKEKKFMGTIGGVSIAKKLINNDFILTNGDIVSDIRYDEVLDYHQRLNSDATISVNNYLQKISFGVVKTNGFRVEEILEKPIEKKYVNAGVYAFNKKALNHLKINKYMDVPDFINSLISKKFKVNAFALHEDWNDIGLKENLKKFK